MGVAETIRSVRIELSSGVTGDDVHFCEIASASNLDIVRRFNEVDSLEGAI